MLRGCGSSTRMIAVKKLMTAKDLAGIDVALAKSRLEAEGIACLVRNENLSMLAGEILPFECYQELWVCDDADFDRAREILESIPEPSDWPEDAQS